MTFAEIALYAEKLQEQAKAMESPSYSNYKQIIDNYRRILNDVLVLVRELAQNLTPADENVVVIQAGDQP